MHWTGTAFGLTFELYRFWSKSGYEPVYASSAVGYNWGTLVRNAACAMRTTTTTTARRGSGSTIFGRFQSPIPFIARAPFRELPPSLALSVLNPQVQYDDNDKQSGAGRDAVIRTDNEILSPHLRRLEKYSSSLVDHHVITGSCSTDNASILC